MLSRYLWRILIGTLPAGRETPLPNPFNVKSSCTSLPSSSISQSNRLITKAVVSSIWRFAKCRPGHCRGPPPYGIHDPSKSFIENVGEAESRGSLFSPACSDEYLRNLSIQNWLVGCSLFTPVFHTLESMCATVVGVTMTFRLGITQSRIFMSTLSGILMI